MKKIILSIVIAFICNVSIAQNFAELVDYEFKTIESYKTEESKVLQCTDYMFNTPYHKKDINRLSAIQYILKWMEGTPDYTFELGEKSMELTKGNSDLLGLYFAAMTKVVLENKGDKLNKDEIYSKAEALLVDYCANTDNKMKPSKKIKKILKNRAD